MDSDEQRSPWFPVQPEGQPSEDQAATPETAHEPTTPAVPATSPPATGPSFDDVLAPPQSAPPQSAPAAVPPAGVTNGGHPFELTPSRPSVTRPPTTPIPHVTARDDLPQDDLPQDVAPQDVAPQVSQPQAFSPYLNAERPGAPRAAYEPPVAEVFEPVTPAFATPEPFTPEPAPVSPEPVASAPVFSMPADASPTPSADDAWAQDRRAGSPTTGSINTGPINTVPNNTDPVATSPFTSGPIEQVRPPVAETPRPDSQQPILYAPWTGAIPQVQPQAPSATPVQTPMYERTPEPVAPSGYEAPPVPEAAEPFLVHGLVPTPIEADDGEIVAPILPPDATEIQPQGADPLRDVPNPSAPVTDSTPQWRSANEYVPDAPDPVQRLAASALSNASLEAAGAPTPRGGVPLVGGAGDPMPSFGEEEPFVPRFEPFGGVVAAAVPTVSFTTPKPVSQPISTPPTSPLSDLAIPESDEPAYIPKEDFLETEPWYSNDAPAEAQVPTHEQAEPQQLAPEQVAPEQAAPARPWAAVDPAEVEFVEGETLAVESGAFGSATPDAVEARDQSASYRSTEPMAPSWEGIMGGATETPYSPAVPDAPTHGTHSQFPTVDDPASAPTGAASWDDEVTAIENTFDPQATRFPSDAQDVPGEASAPIGNESAPDGGFAPTTPLPPVTPVASFFAATAARNARRFDDVEGDGQVMPADGPYPTDAVAPDPTPTRPLYSELAHSTPADTLRPEPIHTTATAYTPPTGEWARPAFAHSDAVTQVDGMAHVEETSEFNSAAVAAASPSSNDRTSVERASTHSASPADRATAEDEPGDKPPLEVTTRKTHRRRRLVLWIVLGALLAAAAGTVLYRLYFLPEPLILPVPTVTAAAPAPTAEPVTVTDSSDFVKAMPGTVGTDVLVAYEVTDTVGDLTLPARTAEKVTLEYGPGSSSKVFTVEAFQHYNEDDAKTAYDSYATGATDVEDVTVGGTDVGKRAYSTKGSTGTVVWRNGTVVFDLTGPSDDVLHFFEHFGI